MASPSLSNKTKHHHHHHLLSNGSDHIKVNQTYLSNGQAQLSMLLIATEPSVGGVRGNNASMATRASSMQDESDDGDYSEGDEKKCDCGIRVREVGAESERKLVTAARSFSSRDVPCSENRDPAMHLKACSTELRNTFAPSIDKIVSHREYIKAPRHCLWVSEGDELEVSHGENGDDDDYDD